MNESDFQDAVIHIARIGGWLVHHARPARTAQGWRTAVQGDRGFPDLVLAHPYQGLIFAELKSEKGRLGEAQEKWIDTLCDAAGLAHGDEPGPVRVCIWRPVDWSQIVALLTPGARAA